MGTTSEPQARTFRSSRWLVFFSSTLAIVLGLVALRYYQAQGLNWLTLAYSGFALIAIGAIIQGLTTVVTITDAELRVFHQFRRSVYRRADLIDAVWSYGSPASVKLSDGSWVHLPGVGKNNQSMAMILKAWIKANNVA